MTTRRAMPELWAGVECTVNRVGNRYFDQLERGGHAWPERIEDLDRFAALGITALRYPVLWERVAPESLDAPDWSWTDARLARLRELGVRPIAGLLHHGSGPRYTDLLDPAFPEKLARYAGMAAARYPWVCDWTPVNEPLTTARFMGLYGHWHPHGRDVLTFGRVLLHELRGVALAMRAIREVIPGARLIQTEDIGKTWSTPPLTYQARFENARRWATFDLLLGRMTPEHPVWTWLASAGVSVDELAWFTANPCPPDILGINHYVTSERYLDHRVAGYPVNVCGGNGHDAYADVEASRAPLEGIGGMSGVLSEVWERYQQPLAITEAHLGGPREEQLRWLDETWRGAVALRDEGADVRAVTLWSLLGAYDWHCLVTRDCGMYESGVFDLRAPAPRPTALAHAARELATSGVLSHPALATPGWWRRPERMRYPSDHAPIAPPPLITTSAATPLLILGATSAQGRAFEHVCAERGLVCAAVDWRDGDLAALGALLDARRPWAVINAADDARVDDVEREPATYLASHVTLASLLASACASRGLPLVTFSSDLVFDGARDTPYVERDTPAPLNAYGRAHAEAEARVLAAHPAALVVRASALFGARDVRDDVVGALRALASGKRFDVFDGQVVSPTYLPDLIHACLDLLLDGEAGLWHLANQGEVTWAGLARRAASLAGVDPIGVRPRPAGELGLAAPRPRYSALGSERGWLLPTLDDALARFVREHELLWADAARDTAARRGCAA